MSTNYKDLPDYMTVSELQSKFIELLGTINNTKDCDNDCNVEGLWELSNRQWHTYTLLDEGIRTKIDYYLQDILQNGSWQSKATIFLVRILSIIGNLGLQNSYQVIKELNEQEIKPSLKKEITSFLDETNKYKNGKIEDPYSLQ